MTIKSQLSFYQQQQLKQIKYLSEAADTYLNRTKNSALRKHVLEKQRIKTYSSEYEHIRNHVQNSATPSLTKNALNARTAHLKSSGAKALDSIN